VLAEDKLFATLGTSVGKMYLENTENTNTYHGQEVLLNDTIGFIKDLPPDLIVAFTSTLEDSVESDVLLHIIDAGDIWMDDKIHVVNATLETIGASQERWLIFNKIDSISENERKDLEKKYKKHLPLFVSAMS
jgi:GTP-binding protein HflX